MFTHEKRSFDGAEWLKVFSHKHVVNDCFANEEEALHCDKENKFSILDEINDKMRIKGKFEFIIEYPNISSYFRWRQRLNPVHEEEVAGVRTAKDFEPIYNGSSLPKWGGLVKSTIPTGSTISSLLVGYPGNEQWYFSIGMYNKIAGWDMAKGIPGPEKGVSIVNLWLRLKFKCTNVIRQSRNINTLLLTCILCLSYV